MEKFDGNMTNVTICSEPHNFKVYLCDDNKEPYFVGYCTKCGYTIELKGKYLDEVFKHGK